MTFRLPPAVKWLAGLVGVVVPVACGLGLHFAELIGSLVPGYQRPSAFSSR